MNPTPEQLADPRTVRLLLEVARRTDEWCNAPPESRDLLARVKRHERMEDALARLAAHLAAPSR